VPKPNPLTQGLKTTQKPTTAGSAGITPSRTGRVLVGGHFAPEVQTAMKIIAAEERTTMQALLAEGINAVFAKRHKPEIAGFTANH
jgi:hypothetical protein